MRQRYAYGSNIAAVRCGWDVKIKEQWRIKDSNLQSGAVLWLRHSFARAFYWGFCHVERSETSLCLESRKILPIRHCEALVEAINRAEHSRRLIASAKASQ
ncbi:MAG: hypothetical protein K2F85_00315, partial [Helicobacter sp.]|nr:hypothetical protein [Helicobacter sp.]